METKFKTLTYCGEYVDTNKLQDGIYTTVVPSLYRFDKTIDDMVKDVEKITHICGDIVDFTIYIENLKLCKLVEIEINVI